MAPSKKACPECGEELWAMHMPRHLFYEHGIGEAPGGVSQRRGEENGDPSVPGQGTASRSNAGGESGENGNTSQYDGTGVEAPPTPLAETAPRKPKLLERFRSRRGRGHAGGQKAPASVGERAPKRPAKYRGKRVPLDSDVSDIWAFGGRRLENTPHFATGRMLQYQAPAAGLIIDRAIAGTLPDRILFQPLARNRDKYEDVAFLLAGPLLTFTITTTGQQLEHMWEKRAEWTQEDQEKFQALQGKMDMLKEMFVWAARQMLPRLAEGVEKARKREAEEAAAIAQAFPDLGTEDPVQMFISMMFEPPTFQEAQANGKPDRATAEPAEQGSVFE